MSVLRACDKARSALTQKIEGAPFFYHLLLALASGIALSFIQAPYDLWFLIFPCLGLFYFLYVSGQNKKQVFALSFLFALGYFVAGLNWIGNALLVEGNDYKWVWPLAVIALPALLSLFTALYVTISHILFSKKTISGFLGFCALLSLSEFVRGHAFTGFPWNLYGYGWSSLLPMIQSLSILGVYGLTFLTILWGCALGFLISKSSDKICLSLLVVASFIAVYGYGHHRLSQAAITYHENLAVHIIQPNIDQADKWKNEKLAQNFEQHIQLSANAKKTKKNIFIWPETSLPPAFLKIPAVNERINYVLAGNSILLAGALKADQNPPAYYNSLMLWKPNERPAHLYSKSHLVPFGEYIPFQQYIPIETISGFSGFQKGQGAETLEVVGYPSLTALICYEIIFPHEAVNKLQSRPDYLLTVTNDAWYGDSPGPRQHFQHARFRATEQGIPVVRSANTGISGLVDPYGRVIAQADLMEDATITASLPRKTAHKTFYSMFGDKLYLGIMTLCLLIAFSFRNKDFS